jgi:hypothetical protein
MADRGVPGRSMPTPSVLLPQGKQAMTRPAVAAGGVSTIDGNESRSTNEANSKSPQNCNQEKTYAFSPNVAG